MAVPFLNNINLNDFQLINAKVHITGIPPTAAKGQIYLDSGASDILKYHNGTKWISLFEYTIDDILGFGNSTTKTLTVGDLNVNGNMTVTGTVTTVNTEEINLADNIILLNSNLTIAPSQNAGIEIERGTAVNRQLIWNETTDTWQVQVDDSNYYDIMYNDGIKSFATTIADTALLTHGLDTFDLIVQLYDTVTNETVFADVVRTNANQVTVTFAATPDNAIRVLITELK
jgi:hypothetical protein